MMSNASAYRALRDMPLLPTTQLVSPYTVYGRNKRRMPAHFERPVHHPRRLQHIHCHGLFDGLIQFRCHHRFDFRAIIIFDSGVFKRFGCHTLEFKNDSLIPNDRHDIWAAFSIFIIGMAPLLRFAKVFRIDIVHIRQHADQTDIIRSHDSASA